MTGSMTCGVCVRPVRLLSTPYPTICCGLGGLARDLFFDCCLGCPSWGSYSFSQVSSLPSPRPSSRQGAFLCGAGRAYYSTEARTQVVGFSRPEYAVFKSQAEADPFLRVTPVVPTLPSEGHCISTFTNGSAAPKPPYAAGCGIDITSPKIVFSGKTGDR